MPGKVGARVFGRWSCATFVVRYGKKFAGRPSAGRNRRLPRPAAESAGAGQNASLLFARRADVHVDFHAHLHFDDLRSFPGHWSLPRSSAQSSAGSNVRPPLARRKRFAFPRRNRLSHQAQHRASGRLLQLVRIQRTISIRVCPARPLLDNRLLFIERQRAIMVGVGCRRFPCGQPARQFAPIERTIGIGVELFDRIAARSSQSGRTSLSQ